MGISIKQFEKQYIKNSRITEKFYHENFVTLPCNCGEKNCQGYMVVNKENIDNHKKLYN